MGLNNSGPNAMFDITASGTNDGLNINNSTRQIFNVANNGKTIINVTPASEPEDAFVINDVFTGTEVTNFKVKTTGQVYAREIFVQLGVLPDYVFKKDYKLMPLSEVEKYYKANQHLPEVPSEKEVKENGLNVGDMNAILLKKIEELTLYTVELEKKLKVLEEKVNK